MAVTIMITMLIMATMMVISTAVSLVILAKTWPMYKWTIKWFDKAKSMLEELVETDTGSSETEDK